MRTVRSRPQGTKLLGLCVVIGAAVLLASCSIGTQVSAGHYRAKPRSTQRSTVGRPSRSTVAGSTGRVGSKATLGSSAAQPSVAALALPTPTALQAFGAPALAGEGVWTPAGRSVDGIKAVYETTLVPPGGTQPAGIAWMDTRLLSARLYSGSMSPGGGPYRYTAAIQPAQAATLVAAFNGGFVMNVAGGGYYTEGRMIYPLRPGAASLVIYSGGGVNVGAWGTDVTMTPNVVSVRQNLVPLVVAGQPSAQAASPNWQAWGATCGATSCAASVPGIEHQWRSGVGITANGALVYVQGPALDPLQLAQLLVRAGVVRGMELDINPDWPVFATYDPPTPGGLAAPANGRKLLASTVQGPWTFFEPWWARDFITMSARTAAPG